LYTIGGGAVTGFSQWMALYDRYHVDVVDFSVSFLNNTGYIDCTSFIIPLNSTTAIGVPTMDMAVEGKGSKFFHQHHGLNIQNPHVLKASYDVVKFEGLFHSAISWDAMSGRSGTGPTRELHAYVGMISSDGIPTAIQSTTHNLQLTFSITFWQARRFGTT
jgi:hypothetical protein